MLYTQVKQIAEASNGFYLVLGLRQTMQSRTTFHSSLSWRPIRQIDNSAFHRNWFLLICGYAQDRISDTDLFAKNNIVGLCTFPKKYR